MALEDNLRHLQADDIFSMTPGMEDDITRKPQNQSALEFLAALKNSDTPEEAITFSAYMLEPRLAVWWGHECLRSQENLLSQEDQDMLDLAANWVGEPTEENRYIAMNAAMDQAERSPGGWIAMGAGWSGGQQSQQSGCPGPAPARITSGPFGCDLA